MRGASAVRPHRAAEFEWRHDVPAFRCASGRHRSGANWVRRCRHRDVLPVDIRTPIDMLSKSGDDVRSTSGERLGFTCTPRPRRSQNSECWGDSGTPRPRRRCLMACSVPVGPILRPLTTSAAYTRRRCCVVSGMVLRIRFGTVWTTSLRPDLGSACQQGRDL